MNNGNMQHRLDMANGEIAVHKMALRAQVAHIDSAGSKVLALETILSNQTERLGTALCRVDALEEKLSHADDGQWRSEVLALREGNSVLREKVRDVTAQRDNFEATSHNLA